MSERYGTCDYIHGSGPDWVHPPTVLCKNWRPLTDDKMREHVRKVLIEKFHDVLSMEQIASACLATLPAEPASTWPDSEVLVRGILLDKKDYGGNPLVRIGNNEIYVEPAFIVSSSADSHDRQQKLIQDLCGDVERLRTERDARRLSREQVHDALALSGITLNDAQERFLHAELNLVKPRD